jgi:hypothetical protein
VKGSGIASLTGGANSSRDWSSVSEVPAEDCKWEDMLRYDGPTLDSCDELLNYFDRSTDEDQDWASKYHIEIALELHDAALNIRRWKNSVKHLSQGVKTSRIEQSREETLEDLEPHYKDQTRALDSKKKTSSLLDCLMIWHHAPAPFPP